MIVERAIVKVKLGCTDQLIELLKSEMAKSKVVGKTRLYTPNIGKYDTISWEAEWENLADYEKFWNDWGAKPEAAEFFEKWNALVEPGGEREIWNLEQAWPSTKIP